MGSRIIESLLYHLITANCKNKVPLITLEIRYILVRSNYIWKMRYNYSTFRFFILIYLLFRQIYVINAFVTITYFLRRQDYTFCGTFE